MAKDSVPPISYIFLASVVDCAIAEVEVVLRVRVAPGQQNVEVGCLGVGQMCVR
jgi:hypothetical protein